jgi:parvulin-like peptidyl-prolyl isomerase
MIRPGATRSWNLNGRVAWVAVGAVVAVSGSTALSECGATKAPAVASVQGTAISRASLAHRTRIKRIELQSSPKLKSISSLAQAERKALMFLITADWLQAEAAAQGVVVSPSEVNTTYQGLLSGPTGQAFASSLKRRGLSRADELLELRLETLSQKLQNRIATGYGGVSVAQLSRYYRAHRREFIQPPSRRVLLIVTSTPQAAQSAKRELQRGDTPAAVALRFSIDPTSRSAGGLATFSRGTANPTLDRAIFRATTGSLIGPVEVSSAGSFYVFKVLSSAPGGPESLSQATPTIHQTLQQAGQQQQFHAFVAAYRQRWKQRTDCQPGYIIAECRNGPPLPAS